MQPVDREIFKTWSRIQAEAGCHPWCFDMENDVVECDHPEGAKVGIMTCDMEECLWPQLPHAFIEPLYALNCWATRDMLNDKYRVHAACYYWWAFKQPDVHSCPNERCVMPNLRTQGTMMAKRMQQHFKVCR